MGLRKEGDSVFHLFFGWEVTPNSRAGNWVSSSVAVCWQQCRCDFPGQQPCKLPNLLSQFHLKMSLSGLVECSREEKAVCSGVVFMYRANSRICGA